MKEHQIIAREALLETQLPENLRKDIGTISLVKKIEEKFNAQLSAQYELQEDLEQENYNQGEKDGFNDGKADALDNLQEWFSDIDNAGGDLLESIQAELEGKVPTPLTIAMKKFKTSLDEFAKKLKDKK